MAQNGVVLRLDVIIALLLGVLALQLWPLVVNSLMVVAIVLPLVVIGVLFWAFSKRN